MGDGGPRVSVWFWVGAACYAAYRYRTTRFTIVPTDNGNLCVLDDADGQRILEQIELHRARQFRSEYDFMPEGDSPGQLPDRKSVVSGKSVSGRGGIGGSRIIKKTPQDNSKKKTTETKTASKVDTTS